MTNPETESGNGGKAPSNQESQFLLDAYRVHLDVWKVQNEIHFRRVQVLMVAVQVGLFAAALKVLDLNWELRTQLLVLPVLAVLGVISAQKWVALNDKQNQYMEFCRRTLRNLEHRLTEFGVPLRYFTLEAHVFGPLRTEVPASAGTGVRTENTRHVAEFAWAHESYPDQDTDKKGVHELARVKGEMTFFERNMAAGIGLVWILSLIAIIVAAIVLVGKH